MDLTYKQATTLLEAYKAFIKYDERGDTEYGLDLNGYEDELVSALAAECRAKSPMRRDSITYEPSPEGTQVFVTISFPETDLSAEYQEYMLEKSARMLKVDPDRMKLRSTSKDGIFTTFTFGMKPADRESVKRQKAIDSMQADLDQLDLTPAQKATIMAAMPKPTN